MCARDMHRVNSPDNDSDNQDYNFNDHLLFNGDFLAGFRIGAEDDAAVRSVAQNFDDVVTIHRGTLKWSLKREKQRQNLLLSTQGG